jgi:hypothetical protein
MINEEDIPMPEKPEPRKEDEIRTTILSKYQNARRPPGKYYLTMKTIYVNFTM